MVATDTTASFTNFHIHYWNIRRKSLVTLIILHVYKNSLIKIFVDYQKRRRLDKFEMNFLEWCIISELWYLKCELQ